MKAWGHNADRELGLGNATSPILTPTDMPTNFTKIQGCPGNLSTIGLLSDGTVWSWGQDNRGTLGDGNSTPAWTSAFHDPTQVPGLSNIVDIASGSSGSMFAIDSSGNLHAWGYNFNGELGLGDSTTPHYSHSISATGVSQVFAGDVDCTYLLKTDGTLQSAGGNANGELGDGTTTPRNTWGTIVPSAGKTVSGVGMALGVVWVLMTDGSVYGIGRSDEGQLGFIASGATTTWTLVATGMARIGGTFFTGYFSRLSDNTAWSIGGNEGGALGCGISQAALAHSTSLQQIALPTGVSVQQWGWSNVGPIALGTDSVAYVWGDTYKGDGSALTIELDNPFAVVSNASFVAGGSGPTFWVQVAAAAVGRRAWAAVIG